ncbi:hypothetical protein D0U04_18300 [Bacillus clarus]|uniref:Uncharacterized protein n=2 Tax=Bacillus clarus TaxID=2338372 RepID=A0ABX9KSI6_9BACI|nr:hypothetical protein D0U04_18300 [Bacillus clarus]
MLLLSRYFHRSSNKYLVITMSISIFLIGGWAGMGVGLIAVFILCAVIWALIANLFIKLPPPKQKK